MKDVVQKLQQPKSQKSLSSVDKGKGMGRGCDVDECSDNQEVLQKLQQPKLQRGLLLMDKSMGIWERMWHRWDVVVVSNKSVT